MPPGPAFSRLRYCGSTDIGSAGARNGPFAGALGFAAM